MSLFWKEPLLCRALFQKEIQQKDDVDDDPHGGWIFLKNCYSIDYLLATISRLQKMQAHFLQLTCKMKIFPKKKPE